MRHLLAIVACACAVAGCASAPATQDGSRHGAAVAAERCSMGFAELFMLAKGRAWTDEEVRGFQALDQAGKNTMVKKLAAEAGARGAAKIRTEDQVGTDGVVYTAFWREGNK